MEMPQLINTREILHPAGFEYSPRITQVQTIKMPDGRFVEVDIWTQQNKIIKVADPRSVQ